MRSIFNKKSLLGGVVAAVAVAATAFAFLSAEGSGSGTGSAAATVADLVLTSESPAFTQLDQEKTIKVSATNPGANPATLKSLDVSVTAPAGCPPGSFVVSNETVNGAQVAAGATTPVEVGSAKITFTNVNANQDACIGNLTLGLSD